MENFNRVVIGDSRSMRELDDEFVHLVVTSPPYWQLKDYGNPAQIGFDDTYEKYINNLNLVWKECARVLVPGCRLCVNIGDQFARRAFYGRYKVIPIRTEIIRFCESAGFDYMGAIIWKKITTTNTSGGASIMGSFPFPRNGVLKLDYEFILIFKKLGKAPKVSLKVKNQSKMTKKEWNEYFSGHWDFPGAKQSKENHLAVFPEELPRRLIKMFSFYGDTILDPFLGSGTTNLAAVRLERNAVGYEINEKFLPVIKKKMGVDQGSLFDENELEVIRQQKLDVDYENEIKSLPYIFKDPVKVDKRTDPRVNSYGSKVSGREKDREKYLSVNKVVTPVDVELSDGKHWRLQGIRVIAGKEGEAVAFLRSMTKGQKVFIRFEEDDPDGESGKCYLYLKNRTFMNAHLIKKGLADVDEKSEFSLKDRFRKYSGA